MSFESFGNFSGDIELFDLRMDQIFLYDFCCSVFSGIVPESIANKLPGFMCHARWLTSVKRMLRLYVATESLVDNILLLVNFISKVYAEMWFRIKCRQQVQDGPARSFHELDAQRDLNDSRLSS